MNVNGMTVNSAKGRENAWDVIPEKADEALLVDLPDTSCHSDLKPSKPKRTQKKRKDKSLTTENADEAFEDLRDISCHSDLKQKRKRAWKKPKDKPMRPLSAYNMFFRNLRELIVAGNSEDPTPEEIEASVIELLESKTRGPKKRQDRVSHGQISFGDLARTIAAKWKVIDPSKKAIYEKYAKQERTRYKEDVVVWKEKKEKEFHEMTHRPNSLLNSSVSLSDSGRSLESSVPSLSASLTSSFNPSDSMSSAHGSNRTTQEDVIERQQDILRRMDVAEVLDLDRNIEPERFIYPLSDRDDDHGRNLIAASIAASTGRDIANTQFSGSHQSRQQSSQHQLQHQQQHQHQHQQQQQHQHQQAPQSRDHQQQILLRLQEQQLRQLLELQKVRDQSSKMSNFRTTNAVALLSQFLPTTTSYSNQQQSYSAQQLEAGHISVSEYQRVSRMEQSERDQQWQLEEVTKKLDTLKQQQQHMNHRMKGICKMGDPKFGEVSTHSTMPSNINNSNNYSAALFDSLQRPISDREFDGRQRMSHSFSDVNSDGTNLGRSHASFPTTFNHADGGRKGFGHQQDSDIRHNSLIRTEDNNVGIWDNFSIPSDPPKSDIDFVEWKY